MHTNTYSIIRTLTVTQVYLETTYVATYIGIWDNYRKFITFITCSKITHMMHGCRSMISMELCAYVCSSVN